MGIHTHSPRVEYSPIIWKTPKALRSGMQARERKWGLVREKVIERKSEREAILVREERKGGCWLERGCEV